MKNKHFEHYYPGENLTFDEYTVKLRIPREVLPGFIELIRTHDSAIPLKDLRVQLTQQALKKGIPYEK